MDVPTNVFQKLNWAFLEILIFLSVMGLQILKNWPKIHKIAKFWLQTLQNVQKNPKNPKNLKILASDPPKCRKKSKFQKKLNSIFETYKWLHVYQILAFQDNVSMRRSIFSWKFATFSYSDILPIFWDMPSLYMFIKYKAAWFEESMTTFWKDDREGYKIHQNEQKQFFDLDPPIPLMGTHSHWSNCCSGWWWTTVVKVLSNSKLAWPKCGSTIQGQPKTETL